VNASRYARRYQERSIVFWRKEKGLKGRVLLFPFYFDTDSSPSLQRGEGDGDGNSKYLWIGS